MTAAAWCAASTPCGWSVEGDPAEVDAEARRHSGDGLTGGPGHATLTSWAGVWE